MEIRKSSNHSKITGDFAEALVLYWLSKYGFECARVDHTGIDLIARNPTAPNDIMGVSVKSRSRTPHTADASITIPADSFTKAKKASDAFGCVPYFAIVVYAKETIRVFITSMTHFLEVCPVRQRGAYWKVSPQCLNKHLTDDKIMMFQFEAKTIRWWKQDSPI
jgi:Holliday junction resolvase-like predicted endonuclease